MPFMIRSIHYANVVAGVVSIGLGQTSAAAQPIALPEISVTSPSPILTRPGTPPLYTQDYPVGVLPVATDTYSSVTVVPRADIIREQPRTLCDALFDKPGISGTTYAPGGASRPIIRGLDSNRVRIQENGIGVHDVSNLGEDHAIPVNPLIADQIEVIRGPATLRYGSQAIGGVVSVDNNRIPKLIPIGGMTGQVLGGLYRSIAAGRRPRPSRQAASMSPSMPTVSRAQATITRRRLVGSATPRPMRRVGRSAHPTSSTEAISAPISATSSPSITSPAARRRTLLRASTRNRTRSRSRASIASSAAPSRRRGSGSTVRHTGMTRSASTITAPTASAPPSRIASSKAGSSFSMSRSFRAMEH